MLEGTWRRRQIDIHGSKSKVRNERPLGISSQRVYRCRSRDLGRRESAVAPKPTPLNRSFTDLPSSEEILLLLLLLQIIIIITVIVTVIITMFKNHQCHSILTCSRRRDSKGANDLPKLRQGPAVIQS